MGNGYKFTIIDHPKEGNYEFYSNYYNIDMYNKC